MVDIQSVATEIRRGKKEEDRKKIEKCGPMPNVMAALCLCNRAGHYIFALWFLSSSIFFLSSPNLSGLRLDVYHTSTHGVTLVRI